MDSLPSTPPRTPPQQRKAQTNATSPKALSSLPEEKVSRLATQPGKFSAQSTSKTHSPTVTNLSSANIFAASVLPPADE